MKSFNFEDFTRYLAEIKGDTFSDKISEETFFYNVDLDSMDAVELFFMIEQDYGINIPLTIIHKDDTIQQFIDKINMLSEQKNENSNNK